MTSKNKMAASEKKPSRSKMAASEKKPASRSKMAASEKKPSRSKMAANLNKKLYQKKIKIQKIQHGGLRVQNKNKLRVRGPADPLRGSQNSASHLHKIPRIGRTYTLIDHLLLNRIARHLLRFSGNFHLSLSLCPYLLVI